MTKDKDSSINHPEEPNLDSLSALRLTARYRWLLVVVILPLFVVIMLLAANQYQDLRTQVLHDLSQKTASHAIAIDGIAKLASDHVLQLRAWSENYLSNPPGHPSDLRIHYTARQVDGKRTGYTLDSVPEHKRKFVGQLIWLGEDPRWPEVGNVVLDQALEFFALAHLTHDVTNSFQWSYFFSANDSIIALYPWLSADKLLELGQYASLEAMLDDWFDYEIYQAGTPAENPQRVPYWTAPYLDAAGAGTMVSHGAPVYVGETFRGIVGTDLKLETLERFLTGQPLDVGRLLIVDDRHFLLADSAGSSRDLLRTSDLPSGDLSDAVSSAAPLQSGEPVSIDGHLLVTLKLSQAPWRLVYLVDDEEITGLLLPRLLPYAVILIMLIVTVFITLFLLRREFISPALALVNYIRQASWDAAASIPRLPSLWQTWATVVSNAFRENRDATRRLQESEERLRQILNNSSAVVYVRDLQERFILINQHFERLLGFTQDQVIGQPLQALFPPQTVKAFGDNDRLVIEQNSAMEFEEEVTIDNSLRTYISIKFPLYDTEGEIYAVCGISTDITKRKQSEAILHQAALGVSAARGEEVFNSLVSHLANAISVDIALIGVRDGGDRIHTRAVVSQGRIIENITYDLAGSPCEHVIGQHFRFYPDRIQQRFPEDNLLRDIGMESYAAIPLFDSAGEVLGLLAILHSRPLHKKDTVESILQLFAGRAASELERERSDAALRASEASYRAIFEASEDAIFVHDLETGAILDVNQKACDVYGYSHEEMLGIDVGTISSGIPPYTQEDALKLIKRAVAGEHLHFEWHRRNRDNSLHWDEVFARRVPIGGRDRILVHTREITARKEAEAKLRASEEQYRAIINATADALILWNDKGEIVDLNPATWKMAGYSKEEFLSTPIQQHFHESSLYAFDEFMAAVVQGKTIQMEAKGFRKDGSIAYIETRTVPMLYQGNPHVLSISRDITEQKNVEKELARQREALRQNEKLSAMGELLAGVAHELNNPLAILMGRAALLESKTQDPSVRSEVDKIHKAAQRCGRIVHTFLSMARHKPAERKPTQLNDLVVSAIELLGYNLRTSGIEVETRLAHDLPKQSMDEDQVGQVIVNLLVNAQQILTEQPEPRHVIVETGVTADGLYCRVADNGPGVPVELRQRVFDPFFTTKQDSLGTGIGLSVSRSIAREHGGELRLLESASGASFELWIPQYRPKEASDPAAEDTDTQQSNASHALIVEDEPEVAELLVEILHSAGIEASWVNSGLQAMQWLQNHRCDLILSDIRMPDLDGPGLWRALERQYPELLKHTAFITGDTLSAAIAPFLKETGALLLEKPFMPEQVIALVAQLQSVGAKE